MAAFTPIRTDRTFVAIRAQGEEIAHLYRMGSMVALCGHAFSGGTEDAMRVCTDCDGGVAWWPELIPDLLEMNDCA